MPEEAKRGYQRWSYRWLWGAWCGCWEPKRFLCKYSKCCQFLSHLFRSTLLSLFKGIPTFSDTAERQWKFPLRHELNRILLFAAWYLHIWEKKLNFSLQTQVPHLLNGDTSNPAWCRKTKIKIQGFVLFCFVCKYHKVLRESGFLLPLIPFLIFCHREWLILWDDNEQSLHVSSVVLPPT